MIIFIDGDAELLHLQRALADHIVRWGDRAPASFGAIVEALSRHISPPGANMVDNGSAATDADFVTYSSAARRLHVSLRTVSRRVANGSLVASGRRISVVSLQAMVAPPSGRPPSAGKA